MPTALKIFLWSLLTGLAGGYVTLRVGFWLVAKFFHDDPMAVLVVVLSTAAVGVASAVTAGVLQGKRARAAGS